MPSKLEVVIALLDEVVIGTVIIVAVLWALTAMGSVSLTTVIVMSIAGILLLLLVTYKIYEAQLLKSKIGPEALIGRKAKAVTPLKPHGRVLVDGEYWNAVSLEPLDEGEEGKVVKVEGLELMVRRWRGN